MIWAIFLKDWKLLWRTTLAISALQFLPGLMRAKNGLFDTSPAFEYLIPPAVSLAVIGAAFLIIAVVQQDTIPGDRQDWLVRPLRRRDLLLAKIAFILMLVQGVSLVADTLQAKLSGFSLGVSLHAAFAHNLYALAIVTLPALAIAVISRSMMEAIATASTAVGGGIALEVIAVALQGGRAYSVSTIEDSVAWIGHYSAYAVILAGVSAVVALQYFQRRTALSRVLSAGVLVCAVCSQFIPWKFAFALETALSSNPHAANSMTFAFDSRAAKEAPRAGSSEDRGAILNRTAPGGGAEIAIPIRVNGLIVGDILRVDRAMVHLRDGAGAAAISVKGDGWVASQEGLRRDGGIVYQTFELSGNQYGSLLSGPLNGRIALSLTLLRQTVVEKLPAVNGEVRNAQVGWCRTRVSASGDVDELRCTQPGNTPLCRNGYLEDESTKARNPALFFCEPDYGPGMIRSSKDPMSKYGLNLPFHDDSDLIHYPVGTNQLRTSYVVMQVFEPQVHFDRTLNISGIDLADWTR